MKSIVIGFLILGAAVFAVLPPTALGFGPGWGVYARDFLRGALPVAGVLVGLIAVFIGIADLKDRAEAKKEKEAQE